MISGAYFDLHYEDLRPNHVPQATLFAFEVWIPFMLLGYRITCTLSLVTNEIVILFYVVTVDGLGTKVNEEGIAFYNNLINALVEKGMEPFVLNFP